MKDALKLFLDAVQEGQFRRDLFLFEKNIHRQLFKLELVDDANARGMHGVIASSSNVIWFDDGSEAVLRVGHAYVDREFRGSEFTAIHGTECLAEFPYYKEISEALRARVRP